LHKPPANRQFDRLTPQFAELSRALERKAVLIQGSPAGINPELALVIEVIGTVERFFNAVKRVSGLEWISESDVDEIESDDDFYLLDKDNRKVAKLLSGKVYCILSNKTALEQLLSLWGRYQSNPGASFDRNYGAFKKLFESIKTIREWNSEDRMNETGVLEYWREATDVAAGTKIPFEIELFFRNDTARRLEAESIVSSTVRSMGGEIVSSCILEEIRYHGILATLSREQIAILLEGEVKDIALAVADDVMFIRPTPQMVDHVLSDDGIEADTAVLARNSGSVSATPVLAVLDGMPAGNHPLLKNRLIVDDPDDFQNDYQVVHRKHGTGIASLVIYGDLNYSQRPHGKMIYLRPVLKPNPIHPAEEEVPQNCLFVDTVHRSVKRMFEGDDDSPPVAPSIRVINLSIGDPRRQYINSMSPLARLLDWLSHKYQVVFIVSAGNHGLTQPLTESEFEGFTSKSLAERTSLLAKHIKSDNRNRRILSPAESINALTVGALFSDGSEFTESNGMVLPSEDLMPSPVSSFGFGHRRSIKPELFVPGGRQVITGLSPDGALLWSSAPSRKPGCLVAAPEAGTAGTRRLTYTSGTSNSAAQLSHDAGECYDTLDELFLNEIGSGIPNEFSSVLLKAMLVHGASWDSLSSKVSQYYETSEKRLAQWLGYGLPDIARVQTCTEQRVTAIGYGVLKKEQGHLYTLPAPITLSNRKVARRLTVTLAYLSPIQPNKQQYRSALLWFTREGSTNDRLVPDRQNTDEHSVRRGTIQHEIFTGESPIPWGDTDSIELQVSCVADADTRLREAVPYALFITLEVAEGLDIDLYLAVQERLRQATRIEANV
jgi:hypothetical protein